MSEVKRYTASKNNISRHVKGRTIGTTDFVMVMASDYDAALARAIDLLERVLDQGDTDGLIGEEITNFFAEKAQPPTSAEPKPRGEPVMFDPGTVVCRRYQLDQYPGQDFYHYDIEPAYGSVPVTLSDLIKLVSPPHSGDANEMVAKLVLPERKQSFDDYTFKGCRDAGYNEALDEVAKLNGVCYEKGQ